MNLIKTIGTGILSVVGEKFATTAMNFIKDVKPFLWLIILFGCVVAGLILAFGEKNEKIRNAKGVIVGCICGALIIGMSVEISQTVIGWFVF